MNNKSESTKGTYGEECNRTACTTSPATWYNVSTRAFYCEQCAAEINFWSRHDHGTIICQDQSTPGPDVRTELDEVKDIRDKATVLNANLKITVKDKKGRERKQSFKDQWRAEMAAKRRAGI